LKNENTQNYHARIIAQKPIKTYSTTLPATEDYKQHSVELKIDGLPVGHYFIIPQEPNFSTSEYNFVKSDIQVSNITYIKHDNILTVLNRTTGAPIVGATIRMEDSR